VPSTWIFLSIGDTLSKLTWTLHQAYMPYTHRTKAVLAIAKLELDEASRQKTPTPPFRQENSLQPVMCVKGIERTLIVTCAKFNSSRTITASRATAFKSAGTVVVLENAPGSLEKIARDTNDDHRFPGPEDEPLGRRKRLRSASIRGGE
jgi:hypothetical protein